MHNKNMPICEHAVPASRNQVRPDASKDTTNPRFNADAFSPRGATCALKQFNDGKELPIERLSNHNHDYTCVGPQDSTCPKVLGFTLVDMEEEAFAQSETEFHRYIYKTQRARKTK